MCEISYFPVICIATMVEYESASEAARQTGLCKSTILRHCNGTLKKQKWKYVKEKKMKWIKTQKGNIIRVGAVSEFIPDGNNMRILIGQTEEVGYEYSCQEQADDTYNRLLDFINNTDFDNDIFEFPSRDDNLWLKNIDIDEFTNECNISNKIGAAMKRYGIHTVYDFMPKNDWEAVMYIRGISNKTMIELRKKRDEFVRERLICKK